jgi:polyhydroxyalkanoate synthesis regulator phasin
MATADEALVQEVMDAIDRITNPDKMTKAEAKDFLDELSAEIDSRASALEDEDNGEGDEDEDEEGEGGIAGDPIGEGSDQTGATGGSD